MQKQFQKFCRIFGAGLFLSLLSLAVFNLLVDPIDAYRSLHWRRLEPCRGRINSRAAKAEMARQGIARTVLLGTSRVQTGFPADPSLYPAAPAVNMAVDGTTLTELAAILDYTLQHNRVEHLVVGADFFLFSDVRAGAEKFRNSRFDPGLDRVAYHFNNALGWETTRESIQLLARGRNRRGEGDAERGFVSRAIPAGRSQREAFERRLSGFFRSPELYGRFHYSRERLELFRRMVREGIEHGARVSVFIPPVHALQLEALEAAGLWDVFESWQRDLVRIWEEEHWVGRVPLVDFSGFGPIQTEPVPPAGDRKTRMEHYLDSSHFTPPVGALILRGLRGVSEGNLRVAALDSKSIEEHLRALRLERESYEKEHAAEVEWVRGMRPNREHSSDRSEPRARPRRDR